MIDSLILFCGGPPIYGGSPKPLQKLRTGQTLLERYLFHIKARVPKDIVLLVEESFESDYRRVVNELNYPASIRILACASDSSTFGKLQDFLKSDYPKDHIVMFSYPDIFVIGDIDKPAITDDSLSENVFISFTPVFSRFPRLVVDTYGSAVRCISNHSSPMPANPLHVFGGHLLVRVGLMENLVDTFLAEVDMTAPSLEFDVFSWLINTSHMLSMPIYGRWIQADSPRELEAILALT
jgi:hypothetical protein